MASSEHMPAAVPHMLQALQHLGWAERLQVTAKVYRTQRTAVLVCCQGPFMPSHWSILHCLPRKGSDLGGSEVSVLPHALKCTGAPLPALPSGAGGAMVFAPGTSSCLSLACASSAGL